MSERQTDEGFYVVKQSFDAQGREIFIKNESMGEGGGEKNIFSNEVLSRYSPEEKAALDNSLKLNGVDLDDLSRFMETEEDEGSRSAVLGAIEYYFSTETREDKKKAAKIVVAAIS